MSIQELETRWLTLAASIGLDAETGSACWRALDAAYSSPPRAYHNLTHIQSCLHDLDQFGVGTSALEIAIWFHDAVYDSLAHDNESRSAAFMRRLLDPVAISSAALADAERLILVTADHRSAEAIDEQAIADIDLAILATEPGTYRAYSAAIREEYASIPELEYRAGRAKFLETLLGDAPIYSTSWARNRGMEDRARTNIRLELDTLE